MAQSCWKCGAPPESPRTSSLFASSSADFTHLLASNDVPLDAEVNTLQKLVADGQDRVHALNAQIDNLRATLAQLVQERTEILDVVRDHKVILSPVRRVPPELLCEIFVLLSPHTRRIGAEQIKQPPWYLGQICRLWRDAALSYPLLWTGIEIRFPDGLWSKPGEIYPSSMIETQLLRSAQAPLEVTLDFDFDPDPDLLHSLCLHSDRWRTLYLSVAGLRPNAALGLLPLSQGRLSLLESLELTFYHDAQEELLTPSYVFATALNLRKVILTDPRLLRGSPPLIIPWRRITHYRGTYTTRRQLEILRDAPGLLQCGLGFVNHDASGDEQSVTLPVLRRLYIELPWILNHLTAPALEGLVLDYFSLDPILTFVQRSSCQLTTLVLLSCTISGAASILQNIPTLAYVHITNDPGDRQKPQFLFDAMAVSTPRSMLCPDLTSFVFGLRGISSAGCGDSFVSLVRSRSQPRSSSGLSFIRLFYSRLDQPPSDDLAAGIEMLAHEGIDVALIGRHEGEKLVEQQCP
ncbi:hypothetical protein DFH09DRAFT_1357841 [Mycena vulgaris]|nr:hypothetical protein DFH09DRAFT_1357841 [Mycena vulgaris]